MQQSFSAEWVSVILFVNLIQRRRSLTATLGGGISQGKVFFYGILKREFGDAVPLGLEVKLVRREEGLTHSRTHICSRHDANDGEAPWGDRRLANFQVQTVQFKLADCPYARPGGSSSTI